MARYNKLLATITSSLKDLRAGIQGRVVISPAMEAVFDSLYNGEFIFAKVNFVWDSDVRVGKDTRRTKCRQITRVTCKHEKIELESGSILHLCLSPIQFSLNLSLSRCL